MRPGPCAEGKALTPLNIVVQQLTGRDPLVNRFAKPMIDREKYPSMHTNYTYETHTSALVATELATKIKTLETTESPASMRPNENIVTK